MLLYELFNKNVTRKIICYYTGSAAAGDKIGRAKCVYFYEISIQLRLKNKIK